jgi:hypothetical protein
MNPVLRAAARLVTADRTGPDARTSLADCRIALAIARGRDLDDIHPSSGHDLSPAAYRLVRNRWQEEAARPGYGGWIAAQHHQVRTRWTFLRPELARDWPEENPWPPAS